MMTLMIVLTLICSIDKNYCRWSLLECVSVKGKHNIYSFDLYFHIKQIMLLYKHRNWSLITKHEKITVIFTLERQNSVKRHDSLMLRDDFVFTISLGLVYKSSSIVSTVMNLIF